MAEDDDEYELAPHKQIEELKHEIERLKSAPHPKHHLHKAGSTQDSIEELNSTIEQLLEVFRSAKDSGENDEQHMHDTIHKKLDAMSDDIRKIAQGVVALADMVKSLAAQPSPQAQVAAQQPQKPQNQMQMPIAPTQRMQQPQRMTAQPLPAFPSFPKPFADDNPFRQAGTQPFPIPPHGMPPPPPVPRPLGAEDRKKSYF